MHAQDAAADIFKDFSFKVANMHKQSMSSQEPQSSAFPARHQIDSTMLVRNGRMSGFDMTLLADDPGPLAVEKDQVIDKAEYCKQIYRIEEKTKGLLGSIADVATAVVAANENRAKLMDEMTALEAMSMPDDEAHHS